MPPPFAPTHSWVCPMVTREAAPEGVGAAGVTGPFVQSWNQPAPLSL